MRRRVTAAEPLLSWISSCRTRERRRGPNKKGRGTIDTKQAFHERWSHPAGPYLVLQRDVQAIAALKSLRL